MDEPIMEFWCCGCRKRTVPTVKYNPMRPYSPTQVWEAVGWPGARGEEHMGMCSACWVEGVKAGRINLDGSMRT